MFSCNWQWTRKLIPFSRKIVSTQKSHNHIKHWTHSEHTVNTQWTHSEHTVNAQWTHSEHTVNTHWWYTLFPLYSLKVTCCNHPSSSLRTILPSASTMSSFMVIPGVESQVNSPLLLERAEAYDSRYGGVLGNIDLVKLQGKWAPSNSNVR